MHIRMLTPIYWEVLVSQHIHCRLILKYIFNLLFNSSPLSFQLLTTICFTVAVTTSSSRSCSKSSCNKSCSRSCSRSCRRSCRRSYSRCSRSCSLIKITIREREPETPICLISGGHFSLENRYFSLISKQFII